MLWIRQQVIALVMVLTLLLVACGAEAAPTGQTGPIPAITSIPVTVAPASPTATSQAVTPTRLATPVATPQPAPTIGGLASPPPSTPRPTRQPAPTATPSQRSPEPEPPTGPVLPALIVDVHGNEVMVEDISRIVVMNGDYTEVVYALGLGDNIVAVDTSATYPPEVTELPQIGYQRRISAEGILSMNPTVVIGSEVAGPPEVIEQIRSTGTAVVVLEEVTTIDGGPRKIRGIAQALGVPARGEALATDLEADIAKVRTLSAKAQEKPTAVFLYMRGVDTLFLMGKADLSHELLEASGAISGGAAAGVMAQRVPLTAEALAAANPDCIVVLTRGLESVGGLEGLLRLPGISETQAADRGCILDFDDQLFRGGGPRMGTVLMGLLQTFHPDLATTT